MNANHQWILLIFYGLLESSCLFSLFYAIKDQSEFVFILDLLTNLYRHKMWTKLLSIDKQEKTNFDWNIIRKLVHRWQYINLINIAFNPFVSNIQHLNWAFCPPYIMSSFKWWNIASVIYILIFSKLYTVPNLLGLFRLCD